MYLIGINAKIGTNIPNKPVKYQSKSGNIGSIIVVSFWGNKYIKFVMWPDVFDIYVKHRFFVIAGIIISNIDLKISFLSVMLIILNKFISIMVKIMEITINGTFLSPEFLIKMFLVSSMKTIGVI